jgi:hypothetical protein
MSDPIPGCDPSEAYEVVPLDPIRTARYPWGWWACLCHGIVVRIAADQASLIRYANDPDYRTSLITKRLSEKVGTHPLQGAAAAHDYPRGR